ncbi:MAG TPA: phosphate acyltransferase PlsX [Crenotrichaceae bacterium]|nr:phosphate acyltransferase PlsX [Crenotrichaceae bacterium]
MTNPVTVAIDVMSGDHGLSETLPAAIASLEALPMLSLLLVGDESMIQAHLGDKHSEWGARLKVVHASQVVEMDDSPSKVLRSKRDSSMRVAINQVKQGTAGACVSSGNTGALMAMAKFVLKTIPGIDRPAIISALPSKNGHTHVLDLGANIDSSAEHLLQFALMGSELVRAIDGIESPKVGLLNVGEEEMKGNQQVKQAYQLLSDSPVNFIGYVEGDDICMGEVDVVVTDGFVGNIALKSMEGITRLIVSSLKQCFGQNLMSKLAALVAVPVLKSFKQLFDVRKYNGASLIGLRGIVIKSHGGSDRIAIANAIKVAAIEIENDIPNKISSQIETMLVSRGSE